MNSAPPRLRELIRAECRTRRIEAPADIAALIEIGLETYEAQIYTVIAARLAPDVQQRLDALLFAEAEASGEEEELPLTLLRLDPGPVGVESALTEIAKLRSLRAIGLPADLFEGMPPSWWNACDDGWPPSLLPTFASIPRPFA